MGLGREGERSSSSLPLTLFYVCFPPFPMLRHCLLPTAHYAWNRLVHSGQRVFSKPTQGIYRCPFRSIWNLKAHTHVATILAFARLKRHFFSIFRFAVEESDLFLMMVFHRRSKQVKIFSETFVTKYLSKLDHNTSKRACTLIHNSLKEKPRKKKEGVLIS